jgi:hypothetical protein
MKKKIFFLLIIITNLLIINIAKAISNRPIVQINNLIITELDLNKEIAFIKFISNNANKKKENLKSESLNYLIDRTIKEIEISNLKAKISEKETDVLFQIFLDNKKINNETLNAFYKQNEIEDNYLYKIIQIDASWSKIIRQLYYNRINVNITEIEKENEKNNNNQNFSKESLINSEKNILLNKFSDTHLEKIKKKYLIKFL